MRRRFQFSLRALLVAILAVGVACAWVGNAAFVTRQRQALMLRFDEHHYCLCAVAAPSCRHTKTVPWIRQVFGDYAVELLFYNPSADPAGAQLRQVQSLFPETEIWGWPYHPNGERLPDGIRHWPTDRPLTF